MALSVRSITQVIERLNALQDGTDNEIAHAEADMLLLDALLILGHDDIVTAFQNARKRVGFWYA